MLKINCIFKYLADQFGSGYQLYLTLAARNEHFIREPESRQYLDTLDQGCTADILKDVFMFLLTQEGQTAAKQQLEVQPATKWLPEHEASHKVANRFIWFLDHNITTLK